MPGAAPPEKEKTIVEGTERDISASRPNLRDNEQPARPSPEGDSEPEPPVQSLSAPTGRHTKFIHI